MLLSILIPTIPQRQLFFNRIKSLLTTMIEAHPKKESIELLTLSDDRVMTIGEKRNKLLEMATGTYSAFIDDDDMVDGQYIQRIMDLLPLGYDGLGFKGIIYTDGRNPKTFIHRNGEDYTERGPVYYRPLTHLNPIKTDIMRQIGFPPLNHAEDYDFALKLKASGLVKTSYYIDAYMYLYYFRPKKTEMNLVKSH